MSRLHTILIVDDEQNILTSLRRMLDLEGFGAVVAGSGRIALEKLEKEAVDAVLLDVRMPEMDGLQLLAQLKERWPQMPVIMMSGHSNLETAVLAIQSGAHDFLEKPIGTDRLLVTLQNALKFTNLAAENLHLKERVSSKNPLIGRSRAMTQLRESIALAAPSRARVLISGENGTGKELIARAIHEGSDRCNAPFITVNCAAIPSELIESELFGHEKGAFTGAHQNRKGRFEQANGGTIFLDEIGDMHVDVQAKLLRVLQEEEFDRVGGSSPIRIDVRVLAATNKDLPQEIRDGNFREDLYYRINVIPIAAPPLRNRLEDLSELAAHFIAVTCKENGRRPMALSDEAVDVLSGHAWPGNVRELRNICERLVILTPDETLGAKQVHRVLPDFQERALGGYDPDALLKELMAQAERQFILARYEENDRHMTRTAASLAPERPEKKKKMEKLGIR
jgi:DNA-binding NtrC family response regulator